MNDASNPRIAENIGQRLKLADVDINVRHLVGQLGLVPHDKKPEPGTIEMHSLVAFWYPKDNPAYHLFVQRLSQPGALVHLLFDNNPSTLVVQTYVTYPPNNGDIDCFAVLPCQDEDRQNCWARMMIRQEVLLCIGRQDTQEMNIYVLKKKHDTFFIVAAISAAPQFLKDSLFNEKVGYDAP